MYNIAMLEGTANTSGVPEFTLGFSGVRVIRS